MAFIDVTASPYNAVGDGTTDDAAAFQAAINACDALANNGNRARLMVPGLAYKVIGGLACRRPVDYIGDGMATMIGDGTSNMFDFTTSGIHGPAYRNKIEGFRFKNCNKAIYCPTANTGGALVRVIGCEAASDVTTFIDTGSYDGSRSTVLTVEDCASDAAWFIKSFTDKLIVNRCNATYNNQNHAVIDCMGSVHIADSLFTPGAGPGTANTDACWINFHSADPTSTVGFDYRASLIVTGSEFGSEAAGGICPIHSDAAIRLNEPTGSMWHVAIVARDVKFAAGPAAAASGNSCFLKLFAPPWASGGVGGMPDYIELTNVSGSQVAGYLLDVSSSFIASPPAAPVTGRWPQIRIDDGSNKLPEDGSTAHFPRDPARRRSAIDPRLVHALLRGFVEMG